MKTPLKLRIKRAIPPRVLDQTLLKFPRLYSLGVINYETNLNGPKLDDLLHHLNASLQLNGDVLECGSSRGGSTAIMGKALAAKAPNKTLYACDSFEGFDRDEWRKEADAGLTTSREDSFTSTSYDYVVRKLRALGLADRVKPVRGYFEQTLPTLTGPWCFAFIDCDLKDSLIFCAEQTWDKLESGGRIVFDDYHSEQYQAATEGVDQFVAQHRSQIANHAELRGMYYVEKA